MEKFIKLKPVNILTISVSKRVHICACNFSCFLGNQSPWSMQSSAFFICNKKISSLQYWYFIFTAGCEYESTSDQHLLPKFKTYMTYLYMMCMSKLQSYTSYIYDRAIRLICLVYDTYDVNITLLIDVYPEYVSIQIMYIHIYDVYINLAMTYVESKCNLVNVVLSL